MAKKKAKVEPEPTKRLIVVARVKEFIADLGKDGELRMSKSILDKLDDQVKALIKAASLRCLENGRVTLMDKDF